mmetsp:Transcript_12631/g.19454  ORF Transcript_12631/g.19454 Transcript_12631/m.19454 type:complete len:88 (-) Transcript_12631:1210-1473(-)
MVRSMQTNRTPPNHHSQQILHPTIRTQIRRGGVQPSKSQGGTVTTRRESEWLTNIDIILEGGSGGKSFRSDFGGGVGGLVGCEFVFE